MKSISFKYFSVLVIGLLGLLVYSNSFHCAFHFDDATSIVDNFYIRDLGDLHKIWDFLPRRFLLYLSLALNYHFDKLDVVGYHIFNLVVHVISAILVWWFVLLTLSTPAITVEKALPAGVPKKPLASSKKSATDNPLTQHAPLLALLAGLIFVSHPVQTEAITYIVQRTASMAMMFYVASLCFYIKARLSQGRAPASMSWKIYYAAALLTAVIAMFTKETAITLGLMILLYEFCFLKTSKGFQWAYTVPFLLTIVIIPITMHLTESPAAQAARGVPADAPAGISSFHYLLTEFRVIVTYIRLLFVPLHQNLDYDYPLYSSFLQWPVWGSFLCLAAILFTAQRLFAQYRLVAFAIFWFFLTLVPESSLLPIRDVIYEHRLYLPMVGYSLLLSVGIFYLVRQNAPKTAMIVLVIVAINAFLTFERNKVWKNEMSLWSDTIAKSPNKARPNNNIGYVYLDKGHLDEAMHYLDKAIKLDPKYAVAYNNRGIVYERRGHFDQALADYSKAIELNPIYADAYYNRGNAYQDQNKFSQAILQYNQAIAINPNLAEAYNNRGRIYDKQRRFPEALADFDKALSIKPNLAEAYNNRGNISCEKNDLGRALADFNKAIEADPSFALGYVNRGIVYAKQGQDTQALADFNQAIALDPNMGPAYTNRNAILAREGKAASNDAGSYYTRGSNYYKEGRLNEALADFTKAIELNPDYAEAYTNRGSIYDKQGDHEAALADYTKAIDLDPKIAEAYYNRGSILLTQGHYSRALADFDQAIGLNPRYAEAYTNRGSTYDKEGKGALAIADYTKAIEINPKLAEAYNNRGNSYLGQGQLDQALADFNKVIALNPKMAIAHYNIGIIDFDQGKLNEAVYEFTKAIDINPDFTDAYNNRAVTYYKLDQYDNSWDDEQKVQSLGGQVNAPLFSALKEKLGK